jgi:hypothetical protein
MTKKLIIYPVIFVLGMMLAHYQAQQWVGTKANQVKAGYECSK